MNPTKPSHSSIFLEIRARNLPPLTLNNVRNRSRPVAVMEATSLFAAETKVISLDDKNCTIGRSPRQQVTCTVVNSCLKYNGVNLPTVIGKPLGKLFK